MKFNNTRPIVIIIPLFTATEMNLPIILAIIWIIYAKKIKFALKAYGSPTRLRFPRPF